MAKILWVATAQGFLEPFSSLIALGRQLGHEIEPIDISTGWEGEGVRRQFGEARGFILSSSDAIALTEISTWLRTEIEEGKRLVAFGSTMAANLLNPGDERMYRPMATFLQANFGIGGLPYKFVSPNSERHFVLNVDEQLFFQGSPLAVGVSEVHVAYPFLATYNRYSIPLLVCPDDSATVNARDDFVDIGPAPKAVAVSWPVEDEAGSGGVILFTASLFSENLAGAPKTHSSRRLAENLLMWLTGTEGQGTPKPTRSDPLIAIRSVELDTLELIKRVLAKKHGNNWRRECIPDTIREAAAALRERMRGDGSLESYLFLIDLKKIIMSNWSDFQPLLGVATKGKEASLQWLDKVNEIRSRLYHPARLRENPLSQEEVELLTDKADMLATLLEGVRERLTPAPGVG